MKQLIAIIFLYSWFIVPNIAQEITIKGTIYTAIDSSALESTHIQLLCFNDSSYVYTLSDSLGQFNIRLPVETDYQITVRALGFETYSQPINNQHNNLQIFLQSKSEQLDVVDVVAHQILIVESGDTTNINANLLKSLPNDILEDLLLKIPGIQIIDDKILINGEEVEQLTVDGRDFFGKNPNIALKNLPADIVQRIQLFDKSSEMRNLTGIDDGIRAKTMNVVTKPDRRKGSFGKANASYNLRNRYNIGGSYNIFNNNRRISLLASSNNIGQSGFSRDGSPSVNSSGYSGTNNGELTNNMTGINFSDILFNKKVDIQGNYSINNDKRTLIQNSQSQIINDTISDRKIDKDINTESKNWNHQLRLKINWKIDSLNKLTISPNITFSPSSSNNKYLQLNYDLNNDTLSLSNSFSDLKNSSYNINNNVLFFHRFKNSQRSITINLSSTFNNGYNNNDGHYERYFNEDHSTDSSLYESKSNFESQALIGSIYYTQPIGKKSRLQADITINRNEDYQRTNFNDIINNEQVYDTLQSLIFDAITYEYSGGITYQYQLNDHLSLTAGTKIVNTNINGTQSIPYQYNIKKQYLNNLPSATITFTPSRRSNVSINYNSSIQLPTTNQLQEYIDISNPLELKTGNSNLNPIFSHQITGSFRHNNTTKGRILMIRSSYNFNIDYISNKRIYNNSSSSIYIDDIELKPGMQLSRPENIGNSYNWRTNIQYKLKITKINTYLGINSNFHLSQKPGYSNSILYNSVFKNISSGISLTKNVSNNLNMTSSYTASYHSNEKRGGYFPSYNNWSHNVSLRLKVNLFKGLYWSNFFIGNLSNIESTMYSQDFYLWNTELQKSILKNKKGQIKLTAFDLLRTNADMRRNNINGGIEDIHSNTVKSYYILSFSFKI